MMVYLESIRYSPRAALRNVVAGQQVPMELTSLGRAYLAGIPDAERKRLLKQFKWRSAAATKALLADIGTSISSVERNGYCAVSWQPAVLSVATPVVLDGLPVYALNMSLQDVERSDALASAWARTSTPSQPSAKRRWQAVDSDRALTGAGAAICMQQPAARPCCDPVVPWS